MAEAARPKYVAGKEHGEAGDDTHHGRSNGGEGCGELEIAMRRFDKWPAQEDENEAGQESKKVATDAAMKAAANSALGSNTC